MRVTIAILLFLLASWSYAAENCQESGVPSDAAWSCEGKVCTLTLDWTAAEKKGSYRVEKLTKASNPVTSDTTLVIDIRRFNFLQWGLELQIAETEIASYLFLEKLWKQALSFGNLGIAGLPAADPYYTALRAWKKAINDANKTLDDELKKYPNPGLTEPQVAAICARVDPTITDITALRNAQNAVWNLVAEPDAGQKFTIFETVEKTHDATVSRLQAFIDTARVIRDGMKKTIPQKKSGRIITATIKSRSISGAQEGKPVVVEYFVHSNLGLTYHVGLAYSQLGDVEFKQVRTLSGSDLFAKVKDDKDTTELAAYLSMPLTRSGFVVYGTLGTDFRDPGKRIYAGVSVPLPIRKAMITAGIASGTVDEGDNAIVDKVVDQAGNVLGTRELFDTFQSRRQWKFQFGISFRPF